MWVQEIELREIGFRRRSKYYWQCARRFELPWDGYVSIFAGAEFQSAKRVGNSQHCLIEVSAFHITFLLGADNVHFYYHEHAENVWEPGGHTSSMEIHRHGIEPHVLRDVADEVAGLLAVALHGRLLPRE